MSIIYGTPIKKLPLFGITQAITDSAICSVLQVYKYYGGNNFARVWIMAFAQSCETGRKEVDRYGLSSGRSKESKSAHR